MKPLEHGTTHGYDKHGCRCDSCRAASSADRAARRARRKAGIPPTRETRPVADRLAEKWTLNPATGCHEWTRTLQSSGYAAIYDGHSGAEQAHRVAWELANGPIPDGLEVDHLCRVRHCVNPEHLEPVTRAENIRRAVEARRLARRPVTNEATDVAPSAAS